MASRKFTLGVIQMLVGHSKADNLQKAKSLVEKAAQNKANIIALPECFNSPYGVQYFRDYAESIPGGETAAFLSELAKSHGVYLIGGSIPEIDSDKVYNTSMVFGPNGALLGKFRKIHLFDINVPGKITFKESEVLSPGNSMFTFDTPYCKVGIGICYDIRFAELGFLYARKGCDLVVYPGAFNMTTGPAHWELLTRCRAVDNQMYVAAVSVARDETAGYVAWGHSTVAGPWGDILGKLDQNEGLLSVEIDLDRIEEIRGQIPTRKQRRDDVYSVISRQN